MTHTSVGAPGIASKAPTLIGVRVAFSAFHPPNPMQADAFRAPSSVSKINTET